MIDGLFQSFLMALPILKGKQWKNAIEASVVLCITASCYEAAKRPPKVAKRVLSGVAFIVSTILIARGFGQWPGRYIEFLVHCSQFLSSLFR